VGHRHKHTRHGIHKEQRDGRAWVKEIGKRESRSEPGCRKRKVWFRSEADIYEEKCDHSSEREYLAAKAERDSIKYMQVKYMQDHQDQIFKGVVSGVTEWGIYVEIIENKCEGMVRIRDIKDDYYIFDEKQYAIVGESTKNMIQLGDEVSVKVKHTDLERKHLDFTLINEE
jgi:ribonuclease R/exosome complex exonuclease DIS3/RRP44